jgi:hypothetical protein
MIGIVRFSGVSFGWGTELDWLWLLSGFSFGWGTDLNWPWMLSTATWLRRRGLPEEGEELTELSTSLPLFALL